MSELPSAPVSPTRALREADMKTCKKCNSEKRLTEFSKSAQSKTGHRPRCKACENSAAVAWYADNVEKIRAKSVARHAANPEKMRARLSVWRKANREKARASIAASRSANLAKYRATVAAWKAANPESVRAANQKRRAIKRNAEGVVSRDIEQRLFALQNGKCPCCREPLGDDYHLDHIMPLALGGLHDDSNLQLMRAGCNLRKNAKHPVDYMQSKGMLL